MSTGSIVEEVEGMYRVLQLSRLRQTAGVSFDVLTPRLVPRVDAVDRVIHESGAISPGSVGAVARPWYMHPNQDDHLIVLAGKRFVDLHSRILGRTISFEVEPDRVVREGEVICDTACILAWDRWVFHRIRSDAKTGSRSINLATHYSGFNIDTNFNIYDLDTASGAHSILREGSRDQQRMFD